VVVVAVVVAVSRGRCGCGCFRSGRCGGTGSCGWSCDRFLFVVVVV